MICFSSMLSIWRDPSTGVSLSRSALAQRILQVDGNAVLSEQIGEGFVGQFLNIRHPVARQLLQLVECVIVKGDQFAHDRPASCIASMRFNRRRLKSFRPGN